MSYESASNTYVAAGNIEPAVFVAGSGTTANTVVQANATSEVIGVSVMQTATAPDSLNTGTQYAAVANGTIGVFEIGKYCYLKLGTGGCSAWSKLKPDANGAAVATTTTGDKYYARAREAGAAGEFVFAQLVGVAVV